jgi:cyclophilin family peptidyl-prolyl cis-trans isomerase
MQSAEPLIARLRIAPGKFNGSDVNDKLDWHKADTLAQVIGEIPTLKPEGEAAELQKNGAAMASELMRGLMKESVKDKRLLLAYPAALRAYAAYKPADLAQVLREHLSHRDVFVRAAAAELLGDLPSTKENSDALKLAYASAILADMHDNDAQLAILSALVKIDKVAGAEVIGLAIDSPDYVVRRHVAALIRENGLAGSKAELKEAAEPVLTHQLRFNTKLGQILNTDADYRRAASRKNGTVKAVLTTEKGTFTIDLLPEDAPLTVDNFIKLARARYFNGLEVHRVVPNFVMQDGDPRGDGNGGPGWSIRCEINMIPYGRGAVGMALSGKDTGGSQWFVTHSPQPHLDGGYTVFGKVNDAGMTVVDKIVRGDKILSVKIVEGIPPKSTRRARRKL